MYKKNWIDSFIGSADAHLHQQKAPKLIEGIRFEGQRNPEGYYIALKIHFWIFL